MADPCRIMIADDHGVLRAGLRALLADTPDIEIVGEAADGNEALSLARTLQPDLVLLDVNMPGLGGIEVARHLKEMLPDVRILILTLREDEALLRAAIQSGAHGYVPKRAVGSELVAAIRAVGRGEMYVHPSMTRALLSSLQPSLVPQGEQTEPLTQRETDVLRLLSEGYTNRQIAEQLGLSVRTVQRHRASLTSKLGYRNRAALIRYAREHGLVD